MNENTHSWPRHLVARKLELHFKFLSSKKKEHVGYFPMKLRVLRDHFPLLLGTFLVTTIPSKGKCLLHLWSPAGESGINTGLSAEHQLLNEKADTRLRKPGEVLHKVLGTEGCLAGRIISDQNL